MLPTFKQLPGIRVAAALTTAVTMFACCEIHAQQTEAPVSLQAFDDVEPLEFDWGWIRWLMNAERDPDAEMTLGIVHIKPNQSNPLHVHPNSAEFLHVLSGTLEHRLGDRWITMKKGDTLRIPKDAVHSARTGKEACRVLVVYNTGKRQMVHVD